MTNIIIKTLAIAIKLFIAYILFDFALGFYSDKNQIYTQNILVWLLIYLPWFIGFEEVVKIIFTKDKNNDRI